MRPGAINKTSQAEVTARLHETPNGRTMMISHDDNNDDDSRKSAHLVPCVHFCSNAPQSFSNEFNKTHNLSLFWVEMHFMGVEMHLPNSSCPTRIFFQSPPMAFLDSRCK